jgi:Leucine-rich repeat (LRR) protein
MGEILDNIATYKNTKYEVFECTDKWPAEFPADMTYLSCSDNIFKQLPDNLPETLIHLACAKNNLTALPETLPDGLEYLHCSNNPCITQLPKRLPSGLIYLWCSNTSITIIDYLPPGLKTLSCSNTGLKRLPQKLPPGLCSLYCNGNLLTALPDIHTTVDVLWAHNNQLTELPDLPEGLDIMSIIQPNDLLDENYPHLFLRFDNIDKIKYINECNAMRRAREQLQVINAGNVFLELYMKRRMHPDNFKALLADPDIDVDEYMEAYVAAL